MPAKYFPFKRTTVLVAFLAVISASFTRQIMDFTKAHIGQKGFGIFIVLLFLSVAISFVFYELRFLKKTLRRLIFLALLIAALFLTQRIGLPEVRMHILLYAIVGWFAARDATENGRSFAAISSCVAFSCGAGILEELFQAILPYRYFDFKDIVFNIAGGVLGVTFYLIRPPKAQKNFS